MHIRDVPWQVTGAIVATLLTTATAFVRRWPLDNGPGATLQGIFLAAVCCGLLSVAMIRWSARQRLTLWIAIALIGAACAVVSLHLYDQYWATHVGTYQGRHVVIGDQYTPAAAKWVETRSSRPDDLLFDFAGDAAQISTRASIARTQSRMRRLYVAAFPLIATAILATIQAVLCIAGSKPDLKPKSRILFLAANPLTTSRLDLEEELRSVEAELRAVRFRNDITLTTGHAVRPDDLVRLLRQEQPTIVHFSGHGEQHGVVLRTESGHTTVPGDVLARLFRDRKIALVVLNACYSESQATQLLDSVPAVVGTTDAVADEAARRFSAAFYRTLGDGHSVKAAFRDAGDAVAVHNLRDVFSAHGDLEQKLWGALDAAAVVEQ